MFYGQGIYGIDEFIEIDVTNENDITYYIYLDDAIAIENFTWKLYKRSSTNNSFTFIDSQNLNTGILNINLNNYNLQFQDNNFLIKIIRNYNNKVVVNTSFWYYWRIYTKEPRSIPWYSGNSFITTESLGGGGIGIVPYYKEKQIPNIHISKINENDEQELGNIKIDILYVLDKKINNITNIK